MTIKEKPVVVPNTKGARPRETKTPERLVETYRARRPNKIGGVVRQIGELVPEASTWLRVKNHVHSGFLTEVKVTEGEFNEAVQKYCPELADLLAQQGD